MSTRTSTMTISTSEERTILIYQGNMLAIVKEVQKETVGNKKVMIFTPGYRHISVFDSLLAPDNQRLKAWMTTYLAKRPAHPSHPP